MELTVQEAATLLGKSPRTIRHLAKNGKIAGRQIAKRWVFDREALLRGDPEQAARQAERVAEVRSRVETALDRVDPATVAGAAGWFSVEATRVFAAAADALAALDDLGDTVALSDARDALRRVLRLVTDATHQFHPKLKIERFVAARSQASAALADVLYLRRRGMKGLDAAVAAIERDLLRAIRGSVRRADRNPRNQWNNQGFRCVASPRPKIRDPARMPAPLQGCAGACTRGSRSSPEASVLHFARPFS